MRVRTTLPASHASIEFWCGSRMSVSASPTSSVLNWSRWVISCSTSSGPISRKKTFMTPPSSLDGHALERELGFPAGTAAGELRSDAVQLALQRPDNFLRVLFAVLVGRAVGEIADQPDVVDRPVDPLGR